MTEFEALEKAIKKYGDRAFVSMKSRRPKKYKDSPFLYSVGSSEKGCGPVIWGQGESWERAFMNENRQA